MPSIKSNTYGKTRVRLTSLDRTTVPHTVKELAVSVLFEGDFADTYLSGDNSKILPTDTIKNTVYVMARKLAWQAIEDLAQGLSIHFLSRLPHLSGVTVDIEQTPWKTIEGHPAAFFQPGNERRTCRLIGTAAGTQIASGLTGLHILKTADSAFNGFMVDDLTTLPGTEDRLFATILEGEWHYSRNDVAFCDLHRHVRTVLLDCFAQHKSLSVQHTLFAMGAAVLNQVQPVTDVYLRMPNKHCLLVDLSRFSLDNPNSIFIPTEEPSGFIEARISR